MIIILLFAAFVILLLVVIGIFIWCLSGSSGDDFFNSHVDFTSSSKNSDSPLKGDNDGRIVKEKNIFLDTTADRNFDKGFYDGDMDLMAEEAEEDCDEFGD